ncbi:hypothetical protein ACMFMF_009022 [Clarireedia jacksonii]
MATPVDDTALPAPGAEPKRSDKDLFGMKLDELGSEKEDTDDDNGEGVENALNKMRGGMEDPDEDFGTPSGPPQPPVTGHPRSPYVSRSQPPPKFTWNYIRGAELFDPDTDAFTLADLRAANVEHMALSDHCFGMLWFANATCQMTQTGVCEFKATFAPHIVIRPARQHRGHAFIGPDGSVVQIRGQHYHGDRNNQKFLSFSSLDENTISTHPRYKAWVQELLNAGGTLNIQARRTYIAPPRPGQGRSPRVSSCPRTTGSGKKTARQGSMASAERQSIAEFLVELEADFRCKIAAFLAKHKEMETADPDADSVTETADTSTKKRHTDKRIQDGRIRPVPFCPARAG